jgi:hypothetical protein
MTIPFGLARRRRLPWAANAAQAYLEWATSTVVLEAADVHIDSGRDIGAHLFQLLPYFAVVEHLPSEGRVRPPYFMFNTMSRKALLEEESRRHRLVLPTDLRVRAMACCLLAARDCRERPRIGCDGFGDGLAIDELPFAPAGDQPGLAQNFEMVRDGCGGHAAHGDDLTTVHVVSCRDSLKDPEAGLVGQSFRNFLDFGSLHRSITKCSGVVVLPPERT